MKKYKSLNKKLTSGTLAIGMLASSFVGYNLIANQSAHVSNLQVLAKESTLSKFTNGDFGYTTSASPAKPSSGWTAITNQGTPEDQMYTGVFNHKTYLNSRDGEYLNNYGLIDEVTPGSVDNDESLAESNAIYKSLMINSPKTAGHFGYKTSSSISLDADSYYEIVVTLKTFNNVVNPDSENGYADTFNSFASIYVDGLPDGKSANFENVQSTVSADNTPNNWGIYHIFIETNEYNSLSNINLELWLGSKTQSCVGGAFFNSVTLTQYSKDSFEKAIDQISTYNKKVVRLKDQALVVDAVENSQFANQYTLGWTEVEVSTDENNGQTISSVDLNNKEAIRSLTGSYNSSYALTYDKIPSTNLQSDNTNVLLINNPIDTHVALLQSSDITILQHGYYRISVWMWRNDSAGTPTIKLIDKRGVVSEVSASVSATTGSNEFYGNWTQYNFYVTGNAYRDEAVALQIGLSGQGYIYFDDVEVRQISYSDYSTGSTKSNSSTVSFDKTTTNYQVSNDDFDATANSQSAIVLPLSPKDWTANIDENASIAGVINTTPESFNSNIDNYSKNGLIPSNPGALPLSSDNNNVLMIGNMEDDENLDSYYTSSSITLSSNSYYHFTAYTATSTLAQNAGAYIKCYSSSETYFTFSNISGAWTKKELYIITGNSSITANIDLGIIGQGYAYFDKVQMESSSEDVLNEVKASNNSIIIDLSSESFENYIDDSSVWKFEPANFTATNVSETYVESGVADLSAHSLDGIVASAQSGNNVLYIATDQNSYYYYTSNNPYTFSANTYYKLSVYVQTHLYDQDESEKSADKPYGASLTLNYGSNSSTIYGINTNNGIGNDWTEYSFYVALGSESTGTLQLALGSDKANASGTVLFDNIKLTTIDEETFNAVKASDKINVIDTLEQSEDTNTSSSSNNEFDGSFSWYLIPSLITALAIFVAIIGTLVRKLNWKPKKKVKTSYDRLSTLSKDVSAREQIAEREKLIAELENTLSQNEAELEKLKAEYAQQESAMQASLDEQNKDLIESINTIKGERKKLETERNTLLAKDKSQYTDEQDKKYHEMLKSIDNAEKKYSSKLSKCEKELTNLKNKNKSNLDSIKQNNKNIKAQIKTLNNQIDSIKRKELKRIGADEIEISTPDE